jgi:large subunit ribosomal protein L23
MTSLYEVLRRPIVTEKTNFQAGKLNQYAFEVSQDATKAMVKDAVETLFDVTVERVNIINMPAKRAMRWRSRRMGIRRSAYKKAVVTLATGDSIEAFEGVR